ncbi:hypothetical protein [Dyadobacter sp. LHD-138]|uniref:hypothetical protein n=1 Tax=Dyadobacter sp. LHD-138 TaxID=3071413 RepID=UPI0027DF4B77|nr:hypothetical protein [Dyadobacter sp. LHD-138]MDQ6477818.1 hypothetical protein [Dyadobacter sp. LHD-138]
MNIPITDVERVVILGRSAQYQVKDETNGWETKVRKTYEGEWKGNLVEDMKQLYQQEVRKESYRFSKLEPYH